MWDAIIINTKPGQSSVMDSNGTIMTRLTVSLHFGEAAEGVGVVEQRTEGG